jgi:hypothetical protein
MSMRTGIFLNYAGGFLEAVDQIVELEKVGVDVAFVAEAYSYDAISQLGFLAAKTTRMELATGVVPIYIRTPTLLAMTAAGLPGVEIAGRLVGEDQRRVVRQRARDRHALPHPARELFRQLRLRIGQAERLQQAPRMRSRGPVVQPAQPADRDQHVVDRAELRQQEVELEDEADPRQAQRRHLPRRKPRRVPSLEQHLPFRRPVEQPQQVEQRGLAGAGGPGHRDEFPLPDGERDVAHQRDAFRQRARDVAHVQQRAGFRVRRHAAPRTTCTGSSRLARRAGITAAVPAARTAKRLAAT